MLHLDLDDDTPLRVRLENRLMADPTQHEAAERDVDHSLGYVDALFVVADEPAPADHPAQGRSTTQRRGRTVKPGWSARR